MSLFVNYKDNPYTVCKPHFMPQTTTDYTIESKLPDVGTTIFTKMSLMAAEHNAINLSQGFPDFPVSPVLIDRIYHYMKQGHNQYAPMPGMPALRQAIAAKLYRSFGIDVDADSEITVTSGATEALFAVIAALVQRGDELIVLDPAYDSYIPATELQGGKAVRIPLKPDTFGPDWEAIEKAINDKTRLLVLNTPHNPSGAVLQAADIERLEQLVKRHDIWVLSDEVYEHIIFDGQEHHSVLRYPAIRKRAAAVYSFGKTFHATGWKTGYVVAPPLLTREIRKVHQYLTFSTHTPTQLALADHLQDVNNYEQLPAFYQQKRDTFLQLMEGSRFRPVPCSGTYFQLFSYAAITDKPDTEMAEWLTKEKGVAAIPISVFYAEGQDRQLLRFCFAKNEETLQQAANILCKI